MVNIYRLVPVLGPLSVRFQPFSVLARPVSDGQKTYTRPCLSGGACAPFPAIHKTEAGGPRRFEAFENPRHIERLLAY
jgi:hypothetical protein